MKEAVEKNAATSEQGKPKRRVKRGALGEQATPDKKDYFEKRASVQLSIKPADGSHSRILNKLDDETKLFQMGLNSQEKLEMPIMRSEIMQ